MSGFDKDWLALREPADSRARDERLLAAAVEAIENMERPRILDIGCGTGATFRALAAGFRHPVHWHLFDHDQKLLDEVRRRHGDEIALTKGDLNRVNALPLPDIGLVTASALFDLCSEDFITRLVARISQADIGLYAALSYDGVMRWSKPHPLDDAVTASFNAHQRTDKGFGPSLGPGAWETLAGRLRENGYTVQVAASPWIMTAAEGSLQKLFLDGVIRAVFDYGDLDEAEIRDWADFRRTMIERDGSLCHVGHQDVLALR